MQTIREGGGWEGRSGFGEEIQLGVISIAMEVDIVFTENMAKRKHINNE